MSFGPAPGRMVRRRRFPWWLLIAAFIIVPILEIYVIIQVGQVIGAWWTIVLLISDSIFGSWLIRREGRRAWQALTVTIESGRMPATELATLIHELTEQMHQAATDLHFELAARLRDGISDLKKELRQMREATG